MNTNHLFNRFNSNICLTNSKRRKLSGNRSALRSRIRDYFSKQGWEVPKFYSQGSFVLQTNLNPIKIEIEGQVKEEYDLDDGLYFFCDLEQRPSPVTYHNRIVQAVQDHTETTQDKATCVRVKYADGHHIDLPCYWRNGNETPLLAHKSGYTESDPRAFKEWVDEKTSRTDKSGQLIKIIRFLKAWKNYRENQNSSLCLPSGFILTILACHHYIQDEHIDTALSKTVESIYNALHTNFRCYRPTVPTNEDLLNGYSEQNIIYELKKFVEKSREALGEDCERKTSEYWRSLFGDRFPLGQKKDGNKNNDGTTALITTRVKPLWNID